MRYQVIVYLNDGSKYILEKINTTEKELNEVKKFYKIPDIKHEKALFVARLFTEKQLKDIIEFLINNDYIAKFEVNKINPFILEDDVISLAKVARTYTEGTNWETISFEVINGMFVMGYGLINENMELRKIEKNFIAAKQILNLLGKEITLKNIEKVQKFILDTKGIDDIYQYLTEIQKSSPEKFGKALAEIEKILETSLPTSSGKVIKFIKK